MNKKVFFKIIAVYDLKHKMFLNSKIIDKTMRRKVDYLPLCERALHLVHTIPKILDFVQKYELPSSISSNLIQMRSTLESMEVPLKEDLLQNTHKILFESLVEQLSQLEGHLSEILMVNGDLMTKLGRLTTHEREYVCEILDIEFTPSEDRMSPQLKEVLLTLLEKIQEMHESSHKYYSFDQDGFVEFEDEMMDWE
jgi:hypothetical protein